ncbi:tyrosine-protein phosphatase [Kurthia gibsonii]|uniref:tyrosine-protein phosphatase n=1 Tax=Kurthia gibsonii TaxID=33946 RepID=UPI002DBC3E38|nr:tyrosine-protein phosphatase [Kurthia gibsonii]MEB7771109.1 tyrosine-protein phosphatase [Kurthia gibsonii]
MTYQFEGIYNFHDLGGLKSSDGRNVKKGLLFQSGDLFGATKKDCDYLQSQLKIRTIIDYRNENEQQQNPTPHLKDIEILQTSRVDGPIQISSLLQLDEKEIEQRFQLKVIEAKFREYALNHAAYQPLIEAIRNKKVPILQHCLAGRDRTGTGVFLTYLLLGVRLPLIVQRFIQTQKSFYLQQPPWLQRIVKEAKNPIVRHLILDVNPTFLFVAYDEILNHYHTIDTYFFEEFQLTIEERRHIQDFYLK